jgi:hypothetical protein
VDAASFTFVLLYGPLVLSALCIVVPCRPIKGARSVGTKLKPFGDFVEFHVEITNVLLVRTILILGAIAFLSSYLFYDYSTFFPRDYQMEVFFDERGIFQSLAVFSSEEQQSLGIPSDWKKYQEQYFQQLDSQVQNSFGNHAGFFNVRDGYVHSFGHARVVPEKIGGWQTYHVKLADGELTHVLEMPNRSPQQFFTKFERLPSGDDYIRLSFADLFFRHHILLRTQYKQVLVQNNLSQESVFKLTVIGVTKLTVFPRPQVSNTVYLADFGSAGHAPVAYAIYQ